MFRIVPSILNHVFFQLCILRIVYACSLVADCISDKLATQSLLVSISAMFSVTAGAVFLPFLIYHATPPVLPVPASPMSILTEYTLPIVSYTSKCATPDHDVGVMSMVLHVILIPFLIYPCQFDVCFAFSLYLTFHITSVGFFDVGDDIIIVLVPGLR